MIPGAPPPITGVSALLAEAFPIFGETDAGKALAIHLADIGDALLALAGARHG